MGIILGVQEWGGAGDGEVAATATARWWWGGRRRRRGGTGAVGGRRGEGFGNVSVLPTSYDMTLGASLATFRRFPYKSGRSQGKIRGGTAARGIRPQTSSEDM